MGKRIATVLAGVVVFLGCGASTTAMRMTLLVPDGVPSMFCDAITFGILTCVSAYLVGADTGVE